MIKLDSTRIMQILQAEWNFVVRSGIDPDRIIGVFLYGSQNYNLAKNTSDVDSYAIIIPTFEDFCLSQQMISKELHIKDTSNDYHIVIKDIRLAREMFLKQNPNFMEILYTQYFILNPTYTDIFNYYFIRNREILSHYDRKQTLISVGEQILSLLHPDTINRKKIADAGRLLIFLNKYLIEIPYIDCLQLQGKEQENLWNIKFNPAAQTTEERIDFINDIEGRVLELFDKYEDIDSPNHLDAATILRQGTLEIIKYSFKDSLSWGINREKFLSLLTPEETEAYYAIVRQNKGDGPVNMNAIAEAIGIKIKHFYNLNSKMRQYQVASITSLGQNGTHITITQPELRMEAEKL